ncbi:enoyl-CoA hydratase/isomerase family protein [Haladaptatus halobius]|uniref:enoyl-CoA hydratase/isomerase family protein n=1 Tax=Haladaptatus halobius TaxID=2884875 RepID=UPI001D0AF5CA|nr:enoyl-CoA hydratase-related protein [Haladaptatus halobius]
MTDLENTVTDCESVKVTVGERVDGVVTVTLSRPAARNALNTQIRDELATVLATIEQDNACRVVVVTGDDEAGTFVAGADVKELRERNAIEQREVSKRPRIYERVANLSKPVIARINGHALGGGCELAQACDIRIAAESAKLGQPEINLGLIPGGGGTQRLSRLVGEGQAMRLILSGELIDATEAANIGLVDEVHSDDDLDKAVYGLAESIAKKSPVTLGFAKTAIQASSEMEMKAGIEYEAELFSQLFATEDKDEGIDAFFEDRKPEWKGR